VREAAIFFVGVLASGCVREPEAPRAAEASAAARDDGEVARRFAEWERSVLTALATVDPRLSLRLRIVPTEADVQRAALGAILAEDKGVRLLDGRADIFSFDERARELGAIETRLHELPREAAAGDEAAFEAMEAELLARMVKEELARVSEERRLPRSGSELLRGVRATWIAPSTMSEVRDRDEWLAARVDEIRDSLGGAELRAVEISELEDALDPVERLADPTGFARSEAAIARLRIALGAERATPSGGIGWEALSAGLSVHLGIHDPEVALRSELERTEVRLRDEATGRLSRLPEQSAREIRRAGAEILLVDGVCDGRSGRSPIRGAGPPPERAPLCGALRAISEAKTDTEALAALLAVHDAVAVARWALSIHLDDRDAAQAPHGQTLLSDVPPEREGRFVRFAATRPLACVAVARMASLLDMDAAESRQARAKRWLALGDAPLDFVAKEWAAR
jgi:hypothetical protein